jgi:hypothetical protein
LTAFTGVPLIGLFGSLGLLVLGIANLVLIFSDDRRRDVCDRIGDTLVVKKQ